MITNCNYLTTADGDAVEPLRVTLINIWIYKKNLYCATNFYLFEFHFREIDMNVIAFRRMNLFELSIDRDFIFIFFSRSSLIRKICTSVNSDICADT